MKNEPVYWAIQRVREALSQVFREQSGFRSRSAYKNSHYVINQLTAIYTSTQASTLGPAPWTAVLDALITGS